MDFELFGYKINPFAITPDPRFLFMTRSHRESLAHLLYGAGPNGGFVQLTGEVGTGKTLLIRAMLEQIPNDDLEIAYIYNPSMRRMEFLASICDELSIPYNPAQSSAKIMIDGLVKRLLQIHAEGKRTVLIIDEAHSMSPFVLEAARLLTNLETARHKLLRIILVGQPELNSLLARPDMRQVAQRITARYNLCSLKRHETAAYVRYRLKVARMNPGLFTAPALFLLHYYSGGLPRAINAICERALLGLMATGGVRIGVQLLYRAAREVALPHAATHQGGFDYRTLMGGGLALAGILMAAVASGLIPLNEGAKPANDRAIIPIRRTSDEVAQHPLPLAEARISQVNPAQ